MIYYFYAVLVAAYFQFGSSHPILTNCCQNQQSCAQCSTATTTNCCQNQQSCAQCSTATTTNCCTSGNQCSQPCIPGPVLPIPIPSTTNCCANGYQCQYPSLPCPVSPIPIPPSNNCCASGYQCCMISPMPPAPVIPSPSNCCAPGYQCKQSCQTDVHIFINKDNGTRPDPVPSPKDPDIKCPEYTIKVHNTCQPVFCGTGIYRDGKCIETRCPKGTVWTGTECEVAKPHELTKITITNTVNTNISYATSHTVNFTNPINIFVPDSPTEVPKKDPSGPCCTVVTPHTCMWANSQYDCRSRHYRTCSTMCSSAYVYLRPPSFSPTPPLSCETDDCHNGHRYFYPDCSSCHDTSYDCMTYCRRRSICHFRHCQSVDLRYYCEHYPGSIGCRETDGCIDDWCHEY